MHRRVISAFAILVFAVTGFSATPARAGDNDAARALAVILGLAVLGAAIAHSDDDDDDRKKATRHRDYRPGRGIAPRPWPHRVRRKVLPQECLRSFRTRDGRARMFTKACLNRNYRYTNSLPRDCRIKVRTDRGMRQGYGARCLSRRGYTIARR